MPVLYKIDVLAELKLAGYSTAKLRKDKIIGEATIQRLRHSESVSYDVLAKLCNLLGCDVGDILVYKSDTDKVEYVGELAVKDNDVKVNNITDEILRIFRRNNLTFNEANQILGNVSESLNQKKIFFKIT